LETLKEVGGSGQPTLVSVVGAVATVQVNEVAKLISGVGENLESKTLLVDMKNYQCVGVKINKNPKCPVCA
jgi:molybdopterin/thiamine biosynthesis adenylyltransferase